MASWIAWNKLTGVGLISIEQLFRLAFIVIFGCSISISIHFRHKARQAGETISRRKEDVVVVLLRLVFTLPLFGPLFMYMIHPPWMTWTTLPHRCGCVGLVLGQD